jgi:hypothetical protein
MATQDEIIIYEAFDRHIRELHPAQFEVCKDPGCAAARMIEESAMCYQDGYGVSPLESAAPVVFEIGRIAEWFEPKREAAK